MKYIVLMLLAFLQVVLAVIFGYKKHSKVSKLFILFTINMTLWTVANILLDYYQYQVKDQLVFIDVVNRFGFFTGTLSLVTIYRLSLVFPIERAKTRVQSILTVVGLVVPFLTLSPLVSGYFTQQAPGAVPVYEYGEFAIIVAGYTLLIAILSLKNIIQALRTAEANARRQALTVFTGLILSILLGIFFIIVLPTITGSEKYLFLGYYAPFIFTGSIFYSIVRQQFLDFRLIVARSVAYIILVATFSVIYATLVFGISNRLLSTPQFNLIQQSFYILAALFLAFSFQPIKKVVDRLTNKVFYRDVYEPQSLLNDLNSSLVASIDVATIQKNTSLLIEHYLKPTDVIFVTYASETTHQSLFSSSNSSTKHTELIIGAIKSVNTKVVRLDEDKKLSHELDKKGVLGDIGIIAQLIATGKEDRVVGSLILGPKKSGNLYGSQDYKIMEIIADELVIALQNALRFEEIQAFNVTLQDKVDDATRKLRKANEKLVALDQTKDDFISMASHQLRTPLTSVKGYVSMVIEGDVGKVTKQQKKLLDQAYVSSQRMVYLIADLLNVSRLKTGKFVIDSKPANLAEVVEGELSQLKETAASRQLELVYKKPKTFPILNFDETKIRQVVMNFADNAIYYTPAGGHITVNVEDKGESVEFTVVDDGIGVPKAEQHNLFNKFYRAGNAKKARPDGTGLGLFMAKKVIVAQGGALIFKSLEGKGSTFGFSFSKKALSKPGTTTTTDDET